MSDYLRLVTDTVAMMIGYMVIFAGLLFAVWIAWWETRERFRRARRRRKALEMWEDPSE